MRSHLPAKPRPTGNHPARKLFSAGAALAMLWGAPLSAWADCRPTRPLPPVTADNMGPCEFELDKLSFVGDATQQAACLLRPVGKLAHLGPVIENLHPALATRVGRNVDLPARDKLSGYLSTLGLEWDLAANLWRPISRARDNDPEAPAARYMVFHDTSGPNLGKRPFPIDIDTAWNINNLGRHRCEDDWQSAHIIINRAGDMLVGHDFAKPWRATKFERAVNFAGALKGLFVHVEMVQPRRFEYIRKRRYDSGAPVPGFTQAQYERLALVYVVASVRAEQWLIPGSHAAIDGGLRNGHDDPQNFELDVFVRSLERLLEKLQRPSKPVASADP
jgi:hypothetical protein